MSVVAACGRGGCGSWALEHRLSTCGAWLFHGVWNLLRPGVKPMSPALAGGFFTTKPPGKPRRARSTEKAVVHMKVKAAQSCPSLCDAMDYAIQTMEFSRPEYWCGLSLLQGIKPRDQTQVSRIVGGFSTS